MSWFENMFGQKKQAVAAAEAPGSLSPAEEIKRQIEVVEGELADAQKSLSAATDPQIKESLTQLVIRKTQNIADLHEKAAQLPQ